MNERFSIIYIHHSGSGILSSMCWTAGRARFKFEACRMPALHAELGDQRERLRRRRTQIVIVVHPLPSFS
ncbi:hypothetical protein PVAP13_1NG165919 [Panicum virgatum]|uniref:Uncharacterized protein n=1 Tax=Panicum virgatum TaxID=38727 RepID=A0A8T0WMD7_PANVG|nr:hypothetical protein PVAP13_1NG165919 [Panicum virgatum]